MFSRDSKFKFFYSRLLSIVEEEINCFVKTLPEGYQVSFVKYYPPKYDGALHVVYIVYEPMICYDWNSLVKENLYNTVNKEKD